LHYDLLQRSGAMARIIYGVAGERDRHETRVRFIVEALRHEHELIILASGQTYENLDTNYPCGTPNVFVRRISSLHVTSKTWPLEWMSSLVHGASIMWRTRTMIEWLGQLIDECYPMLVITDHEPVLAHAALVRGVPLIRLDSRSDQEDTSQALTEIRRLLPRARPRQSTFFVGVS